MDESTRQLVLSRYGVLDIQREPIFKRLTEAAAAALAAPRAFITLHAEPGAGAADVRQDAEAGRLVARAPLVTAEGVEVGTLWVVDRQPRADLTPTQTDTLSALAAAVVAALEMRADSLERKAVEEELKVKCDLLEMAEVMGNLGHWHHDVTTGVLEMSSQMRSFQPPGRSFTLDMEAMLLSFVEEDRPSIFQQAMRAESGGAVEFEGRLLSRDGEPPRHVFTRAVSLLDDSGQVVSRFGVMQDITDHKRALADAQQASQAKADFLANMSHEMRTPLTSIIGFAGLLKDSPDLAPGPRVFADRIFASSEGLLALVNDVLDFSKFESGQVTLEERPFNLKELVRSALGAMSMIAESKGLRLTLDDRMPGIDWMVGDEIRVRQVLLNLLSNAAKFTLGGGDVVVRLESCDSSLRLSVQDNGCGIAPDQQQRLFRRFAQADDSTARRFGGTGLGLAICQQLVTLMGGSIGCESVEGEGSNFSITVPLRLTDALETADPAGASGPAELRSRVLVVDDVDFNRELVRLLLEPLGCEIHEAAAGAVALDACRAMAFDLIIMDINMPGMDGLETTAKIRGSCPLNADSPIVAFTASADADSSPRFLRAGMGGCLSKPISLPEFYGKIGEWLTLDRGGQAALGGLAG